MDKDFFHRLDLRKSDSMKQRVEKSERASKKSVEAISYPGIKRKKREEDGLHTPPSMSSVDTISM